MGILSSEPIGMDTATSRSTETEARDESRCHEEREAQDGRHAQAFVRLVDQTQVDGRGIRDEWRSLVAYGLGCGGIVLLCLLKEGPLLEGHFTGTIDV